MEALPHWVCGRIRDLLASDGPICQSTLDRYCPSNNYQTIRGLHFYQSHEDLSKIYEALTYFIFDKPLLLKKLEPGMRISKQLFKQTPVGSDCLTCAWNCGLLQPLVNWLVP